MRVFDILFRAGEIPPPPLEIQGADLDIVYISPLARAQKESTIYSIQAFMQDAGLLAQAQPAVLDKIDFDTTLDIISQIRGISPEMIKSDGDVAEIRKMRAEQQAQIAQAAELQQGVETIKTGSEAAANLKPEAK